MGSPIFPINTTPEEKYRQAKGESFVILAMIPVALFLPIILVALGCK